MVAGIAPITLGDCGVLADVEQREAVLVTQQSGRVLDQDRRPSAVTRLLVRAS
jgi:hypothetical protein